MATNRRDRVLDASYGIPAIGDVIFSSGRKALLVTERRNQVSSDSPDEKNTSNCRPENTTIHHSQVVRMIHNVQVSARSWVVGTRDSSICISPVVLTRRCLAHVLDVTSRDHLWNGRYVGG